MEWSCKGWDVWCAADAWMLFFNDKERAMALVEDGETPAQREAGDDGVS